MKNLRIYVLLIILTALQVSCTATDNADSFKEKLIGTWVLDSASTPSGKYYKVDDRILFSVKNKTDYLRAWQNGDVGGNDTGIYAITINPNRALATVSFIPNIQTSHNDTIRMRYLNFDIVELSAKRLHTINQTEFIERKGIPAIIFNKHCIYKRSK